LFLAALLLVASAIVHPTSRAEEGPLRARLASARLANNAQGAVPEGAWLSIEHALDVSERIAGSFTPQSQQWAARASRWLDRAERGQDPIAGARGEILMRGYRSPISQHLQGYAIYTPKDYDPAKKYPLLVMLHGGSANGNLFLGVVLGNNMNWKEYDKHLWDEYAPRWSPELIVVAPDGFGHVMWRWMGEQDVLDVIADVQKHYAIDPERIALGGLSNGGVGAYNIGMRHASRFSIVTPIAGAPSWLQYAGGRVPEAQERSMIAQSGMQLAENAINTDLRYFHGRTDGGPMKPRFIEELTAYIKTLNVPFTEKWFDAGHDLLYLVHRHGKIYGELLAPARRKSRPPEVRVTTSDYRANEQHWVKVTRIAAYPAMARVRAVATNDRIDIETRNVRAFELDLRAAPVSATAPLKIAVDGYEVCAGPRSALGDVAKLVWDAAGKRFKPGSPIESGALEKKPKLSGPISDAYFDAMIHVYGTGDAQATAALKRTAERSASGSPLWLWRVKQRVLADTEVTAADLQNNHVVLYATPGSNALLSRMQDKLPVKIDAAGVLLGSERFSGRGVGVKLIYPNPLAKDRYVIVQAAPTAAGVDGGRNLPDFLPDYVVYDATTTATRPRLAFGGKQQPRTMGYFDDAWQLAPQHARAPSSEPLIFTNAASVPLPAPASALPPASADPSAESASAPSTTAPPTPPVPTVFAAGDDTPAGRAARQIAKRVALFPSYRSKIKHALWSLDPRAHWSIRDDASCLQALAARGVQARAYEGALSTPVPTPVEVLAPVDGVTLRMIHARRTLLMSCELAARLPELAAILRAQGVTSIDVMSSYRDHPWASFHTLGLALDISKFETADGPLVVRSDFEKTPVTPTCDGEAPLRAPAQRLRAIACALAASHLFSSVLTPNYNVGHHDHFHLDVRPDDPRIFVR
jgi:predicted esterase